MAGGSDASSSTSAFVSALIFNGVIFLILILLFVFLRPKNKRVYQPKTLNLENVKPEERPPEVPSGPFAWVSFLLSRPQAYLLHYAGLDGYLFLRYLSIFAGLAFIGCIILFPILLPVNATNGNGLSGFELLAFSNVKNENRFFAHVFLSWIYFGLIIFVIYKELVYYVSLRHSIQTTPLYDGLLSSRTLILTDIPEDYLSENEIRRVFPIYSRLWFARDYTELSKLVQERTKLSNKYEGTLNSVISKGVKTRQKLIKKGEPLPEEPQGFIKKEPTHKLGKIPFVGEKVNTIDYSIDRIGELNTEIGDVQKNANVATQLHSVFIEFPNQLEAQRAFQAVPYTDLTKGSRIIGVPPDDIIWENLKMSKTSKLIKRILANTFLTLLIIFWAIPVAVVGCISNINFLIEKVHFLSFINNCPKVLLGLITGILPTVALAILMSLVPVIIKAVGKKSGFVTKQQVELYCQAWFFGFEVVQVFLVVTLASSASSTVTAIIDDPGSAMTLLANNLPKASNFYLSFYLLQGLTAPALAFLQIGPLIVSKVLKFLQNTPRKKWEKYNVVPGLSYGVLYPAYQLLVVIMLCYSIIAPILLLFATFTLSLMYIAFIYNLVYVKGQESDMRGRNYPKALLQTFVGLYLSEICLLGLFIMSKSWGPVALEGIMIFVTVACHVLLKRKFQPLFDIVPVSGIYEARGDSGALYPKDQGSKEIKQVGQNYISDNEASGVSNIPNVAGDSSGKVGNFNNDLAGDNQTYESSSENKNIYNNKNITNDSNSSRNETVANDNTRTDTTKENGLTEAEQEKRKINNEDDINRVEQQAKQKPLVVLKRFFDPRSGYSFSLLRSQLPNIFNLSPNYSTEYLDNSYVDPAVTDQEPHIWIPKDPAGISQYQIAKTGGKVDVSDEHTEYNEKGSYEVTGPPPSYEESVKV